MKILLVTFLFIATLARISMPIGGSLENGSPILNRFFGKKVAFITAADPSPERTGPETQRFFDRRGINATWVKVFEPCVNKVRDAALMAQIDAADAVYFTGGYSDKLQRCMFGDSENYNPTPLLLAVQRKNIVAGSSAGAMVQPMGNILLTRNSIESYPAIVQRRVPFSPSAFRVFKRGLVDVHFSERGRQGRLFVFAFLTKARFAFGVDENSGIIEHEDGRVEFIGERGTVVYDMIGGSMSNATMHYLTEGDILMPSGQVVYPAWKQSCPPSNIAPRESTQIFADFKERSLAYAKYTPTQRYRGIVGRTPIVEVTFDKPTNFRVACGSFNSSSYTSFSNMQVHMGTTSFEKIGRYGDEPKKMDPMIDL